MNITTHDTKNIKISKVQKHINQNGSIFFTKDFIINSIDGETIELTCFSHDIETLKSK